MFDLPSDSLTLRLLAGILFGLILGSFTTMLSYRIPRRLSIIKPPSHCVHCRTPLKAYDLVPILSWIIQKGACRHCGTPISPRYLIIEIATAILSVVAFVFIGFEPRLIVALLGAIALVTLISINVEKQKDN